MSETSIQKYVKEQLHHASNDLQQATVSREVNQVLTVNELDGCTQREHAADRTCLRYG